jgi:hypothetical protein
MDIFKMSTIKYIINNIKGQPKLCIDIYEIVNYVDYFETKGVT